jgi:hypothetical protein
MAEYLVPVQVTYNTSGTTSLADVIAALTAADLLIRDAVSLLPSVIPGSDVSLRAIAVQRLSQESPLREIFIAAVYLASQEQLEAGVVATANAAGLVVPEKLETLLTLAVLVVLFYGAAMARDAVSGLTSEGPAKRKLRALTEDLARQTGHTEETVRRVLEAKYSKPGPIRTLISASLGFFRPSHTGGMSSIDVGHRHLSTEVVADVPFSNEVSDENDLQRFAPYTNITLELHAQDRDRGSTGWAAVPKGVTEKRVRMRIMPPVMPTHIWGKSTIRGDIVLISKLTSDGFEPSEIHLTAVLGD